jgi:CRISPR-associated protein Cas1
MIKRTLYFGNPAYIFRQDKQLKIRIPGQTEEEEEKLASVPIEDIGIVILDNQQVTITQAAICSLLDNNAAIISCSANHLPHGLFLPLVGNYVQTEKFTAQINASLPLKKQLWKQTVSCKIANQAALLEINGRQAENMLAWVDEVASGDSKNLEARAAAYYWKTIFADNPGFIRDREGGYPNNLLNYGYAILRAITARSLVASGLLPTLGIHHHNRYNAYCLADDIMEPYRPFVDQIVLTLYSETEEDCELTTEIKKKFLEIPVMSVFIDGEESPLMNAMTRTTASLTRCFLGEQRTILYPEFMVT